MPNVDPNREDLEHVAGDNPETSSRLGSFDLTRGALGRVRVRYKDTAIFCEVYRHAGEPMQIHWMCPRCRGGGNGHMSRITADRKQMDYDPRAQLEDGGRLNVEAFTCPWELGEDRRMEFGLGMCNLSIVIDNSVARDAWGELMPRRPRPIPMLGNPPTKKIRAQKVVAKTLKEQAPAFDRGFVVTSPADLVSDLSEYLDLTNEVYIAIFINMRNKVVGYTEFTSGSISSVEVHPSGIFQAALLSGAAGMVTVHNHPSGDPTPSNEDRGLWRRLREAGDLMGIPVVDNLVIGDSGRYFSEMESQQR